MEQRQKVRRAVIFAAGSGSRLGLHTKDIPKTLLQVGNLTLFDRIVTSLDRIGITNIDVVVGYAGEKLRSHTLAVTKNLLQSPIKFGFIENDRLDMGNIYSFWLARDSMDEDFILLNSDVMFHQNILELLNSSPHRSALAIDDRKQLGEEEMKVLKDSGGVIKEISKKIDPELAAGEYIGVMKVSAGDALKLLEKTRMVLKEEQFPLYYEEAIRLVAKENDCFFSCSTEGMSWTEIYTPDDLNYARNTVLPLLEQTTAEMKFIKERDVG